MLLLLLMMMMSAQAIHILRYDLMISNHRIFLITVNSQLQKQFSL